MSRLSTWLESPGVPKDFAFWGSSMATTYDSPGALWALSVAFQLTWGQVPGDRVPGEVLSVEGLRMGMCPLPYLCSLYLAGAEEEPVFILCSSSFFATAIDVSECLVHPRSNLCGAPPSLPFPSGTIQKRACEWVWGRLIAQMLHWKSVGEPDVRGTSAE